jgi:subtilase family serine protease
VRHLLAFLSLCALCAATALSASAAQIRGGSIPTMQAARAAALMRTPNMSGTRDFTVITRSKEHSAVVTLTNYFRSFGFVVTETPGRHNLILHGTYEQAGRSARTGFVAAVTQRERFIRTSAPISFPPAISALIKGTSFTPGLHARSLSTRPLATTYGPATGYGPADVASIYDINPLYKAGITGKGVKVAIAACGTVNASDVTNYGSTYGLPTPKIHYITVDGTTTFEDGEAVLDAERVYGTAPGADIFEYLVPDCTFSELTDMFAQIAEDATKKHYAAVSHSYGFPEADYAYFGIGSDLTDEDAALSELAAQDIPVFASSGDNGSWGDLQENETDVLFPASDPAVIAVGGTTVEENAIGNRLFEYGWGGSGGGVSDIFAIPSYQKIAGVASGQFKNLPDVSMLADPNTGAAEYWANNDYGAPALFAIGGTSVAAPTFTGVWTLVDAANTNAGLPYVQNAGAAIYRNRNSAFVDITAGANGFYATQKGYDNVTGVGVPDVARLANSI